jgi:hypothetical protein
MSTKVSEHAFSPLKVKCPLCESEPFKPCKENDRPVIHPFKPEFHAEREAAYLESIKPKEETGTVEPAEVEAVPEPTHESRVLPTKEEYVKAGYPAEHYDEFIAIHVAAGWTLPEEKSPPTQPGNEPPKPV